MSRSPWLPTLAVLIATTCGACGDDARNPAAPPTQSATTTTPTSSGGRLVDIGARSLFVDCRSGTDTGTTIVLEAGLTGDSRTWEQVVPGLPDDVRVCSYDRANVGRSEAAPTPRTARDVVDDLNALLDAVGVEPPYVLVGFSFGGIFAQLYAAQHPDDISGLVLIESNHPDEARQFEQHLTPAQIEQDRAEAQSNPEGIDIYASFGQVSRAGRIPSVPLVVVTATESGGQWPPGWDPQVFDRLRAQQQAALANLVPGGKQVFAEGSGHNVPGERPEIVVEAIIQVLE